MSSDPIYMFLNPMAGRGRALRRRDQILRLLKDAGVNVKIKHSQAKGDLEEQVMRRVNKGAERIIVAGGDGSIHEAVNGILRADGNAALGIIPTGTGNDFAKASAISLNWEHATRLLADRIVAGEKPRKVDAGRCNDRFFANGAGVGFDAKVTRIARSIRLPVGDLVYLLAILRTLLDGITTPDMHIKAGDFEWQGPLTLAMLHNGPWVGGMFYIAPMADNSDQHLEMVLAEPVTRLRILSLIPRLIKGTHIDEPEVTHRSVTSMSITASEPVASQLDGEVQPLQSRFELQLLPDALNLL